MNNKKNTIQFDDLKKQLPVESCRILKGIWSSYRPNFDKITKNKLYIEFRSEIKAGGLTHLNGNLVLEQSGGGYPYYEITFLGALLAENGHSLIDRLSRFLNYMTLAYFKNPDIKCIKGTDVQKELGLTDEDSYELYRLISLSGFYWSSPESFPDTWSVGLPRDIYDYPDISDFISYIKEKAVENYDPSKPIDEVGRAKYAYSNPLTFALESSIANGQDQIEIDPPLKFDFILEEHFKRVIESDWDEAQKNFNAEAWKSCVIMCGAVLEGSLMGVLMRNEELSEKILKMRLEELVDHCSESGLIPKSSFHLSHGLREYRNLIHPGKQIKDQGSLNREEASISINTIKSIIREFNLKRVKS